MDDYFDKAQIRSFVKEVKAEVGGGWSMLGERLQRALIVERAHYVLAGQSTSIIPTDMLQWLSYAMLVEAGLREGK